MKLVEILASEMEEWPSDAQTAIQDGDRDNTIWYQKTDHAPLYFERGAWRGGSWFEILLSEPSCRASDYESAMITQDQWQAEREKQNDGEWKRHRGNKLPIDGGLYIEAKLRCGDIQRGYAQDFIWPYAACDVEVNLMKYRVIGQTQAEEAEVNKFCTGEKCSATAENIVHSQQCQLEHEMAYTGFKIDQIDGPIKWRDTVIELDAYIEEFTRERESLINRLAEEGFALIPAMTAVMGVADVDMGDWRNWKAGDIVECLTDAYNGVYTKGFQYKVKAVNRTDFDVYDNHGENSTCSWDDDDCEGLRFVSRP
jgi:hypothetical protein